jgi:U3 small nucleolar RNA-associated protein 13
MAVTSDQNILFYDDSLTLYKQIAGYNDEILDLCFLRDNHLAVVSNSPQIRVYETNSKNCNIVFGHSDIVLCIATCGSYFATGSKDNTAILWRFDDNGKIDVVATCKGHTGSVNAIAMSEEFILTASQDRTVKYWGLKSVGSKLGSKYTFQAHDKDIQSVAIAPNRKVFATGGLDKLAKLWTIDDGKLVGTFKGHKRGLWCVRFSPVEQVLATGSTDKTVKLWNMHDFSCTRVYHSNIDPRRALEHSFELILC